MKHIIAGLVIIVSFLDLIGRIDLPTPASFAIFFLVTWILLSTVSGKKDSKAPKAKR